MSAGPSTSSGAPIDGHRTLRLHVWGTSPSLPTLDSTSLYAASLLRSTFADNAHVQLQLASASTSLSRVPLLQVLDGNSHTVELIDNVEAIRAFCVAAGLDSALASDEELAAKQIALHALVDDHLLDLTLHSLFSLPSNFRAVTAPAYSSDGGTQASASSLAKLASLPMRFQPSIPSRLRNVVETRLTAVGLWGMGGKEASTKSGESDELAARAGIVPARKKGLGQTAKQAVHDEFERSKLVTKWREVLDVVDAAIGSKVLGVSGVGSLDAHVFGYLAPLVFASPDLPIDTLPRLIKTSYPRLQDYLTSTKQHLFPENATTWASPSEVLSTPPVLQSSSTSTSTSGLLSYIWPFTATSSSDKASFTADSFPATTSGSTPTSTSYRSTAGAGQQRKKPSPSASPEDRKLRLGRALWICSALVGLVGYTFASGIVSVRFVDSDELQQQEDEEDDDDEDEDEDEEDDEEEEDGWEVQTEEDLEDDLEEMELGEDDDDDEY
ncbi:mitochondrial import receptor subunit [Pseudozyma hubeiensis SY62]|uniref:Mitochondrial import receptor subunit n=1 Tax=Pseudozyma hubeiensis (strain SY62) TaxID=1305764 RepID=R9P2U3_PSEHS|nr:mitochondrial import receptor subunit [Pseudozyma hubeiensis SY62]GAC95614.1 mitochondrial import receptor subunit [Pseudozyma hubeiensis SY62]